MAELIIVGDLHIREDEPFFTAQKKFIDWFVKQDFNNKDNQVLFLGDVFHKSKPSSKEYHLVLENFKYNFKFNGSALTPLKIIPNLEIIEGIAEVTIGNLKSLMLPYYYKTNVDMLGMKENYENLHAKSLDDKFIIYNKNFDYIFGHFSFIEMFGELISIDKLKGRRCFGHIHRGNRKLKSDGYLGVPIITRGDEKDYKGKILAIDLNTKIERYIDVPVFLNYITLVYGAKLEETGKTEFIIDITDAPSYEMASEEYKGYNIRNIALVKTEEELSMEANVEAHDMDSTQKMMDSFFEKEKIPNSIKKKVLEVI